MGTQSTAVAMTARPLRTPHVTPWGLASPSSGELPVVPALAVHMGKYTHGVMVLARGIPCTPVPTRLSYWKFPLATPGGDGD